jgi:hypothetical protein
MDTKKPERSTTEAAVTGLPTYEQLVAENLTLEGVLSATRQRAEHFERRYDEREAALIEMDSGTLMRQMRALGAALKYHQALLGGIWMEEARRDAEAVGQVQQPLAGVPKGWKLVPVEPTEEMIMAGQASGKNCAFSYASCYRNMLAAAPAQPAPVNASTSTEACRRDYENRYHKIAAAIGFDAYKRIWDAAQAAVGQPASVGASEPAPADGATTAGHAGASNGHLHHASGTSNAIASMTAAINLTNPNEHLAESAGSAEQEQNQQQQRAVITQPNKEAKMSKNSLFVAVPSIILPNGVTVPSFQVGQYLCAKGEDGAAVVSATAAPWVRINYAEAGQACEATGGKLITELQYLAIAHDIAAQDINWTGGRVGAGCVFQGLYKDNVDGAQPGDFVSSDEDERRWHQLSNGEKVFDFAGNAYSWVFDDVQGDERGLVAKAFAEDSPSIATAPFPCMENGMGWRPDAGANWSGGALVRGGYWDGGDSAGVFYLYLDWPDRRGDVVGFRCTK